MYTKDTNEQAKVNTKRLPRKQRREIRQKAKKKKALHLDSTFRLLSVEHERNNLNNILKSLSVPRKGSTITLSTRYV